MNKKTSSGDGVHQKKEAPVDKYRKEIGKHQEEIEKPTSVKKRHEHLEKTRGENQTEAPQDLQTGVKKTLSMVVIWAVLIGGAYLLITYLMKPPQNPFIGQ